MFLLCNKIQIGLISIILEWWNIDGWFDMILLYSKTMSNQLVFSNYFWFTLVSTSATFVERNLLKGLAIQIFDRFRKYKMEFNTLCSRRRFVYLYLITCKEFAKQHVKFGDNNTRHKKVSTLILRNQGVGVRMAQILPKVRNSKSYPSEILDGIKWFPKLRFVMASIWLWVYNPNIIC